MAKKQKKSKDESRKHESESSSDSSSGDDYSSSSETTSDSETDRVQVKRPRLDSASKKRKRKEKKKLEKKKRMKAENKITKDDFYHKSVEFRLWLMEEKKMSMDAMKTTKAKTLFKKFVRKWNEGKLSKKYYKGIDAADVKGSLTKYKWKFAGATGPSSNSNSPLVDGGKPPPATFSTFGKNSSPKNPPRSKSTGNEKRVLGPQRPPHLADQDSDEDRKQERERVRTERRKFREDDKLTMEELAPRATGHQAKVEKKMMRKHRGHSPEVSDRVLMGSGMDYDSMMARKRKSDILRKERTTERASTKLKEYQEKESAKMKALLEMARANKSKDALW